jgi:hypothetical protein
MVRDGSVHEALVFFRQGCEKMKGSRGAGPASAPKKYFDNKKLDDTIVF